MKYQIFSENEWIYPDSVITEENSAVLYSARNADVCFQVLTDKEVCEGETFCAVTKGLNAQAEVYQLLPAHVEENSGEKIYTTTDYESVKEFVTRRAPFDVYEITRPIDDSKLRAGRAAFYVRLNVAMDAVPGQYEGQIILTVGDEVISLPVSLKVYKAQVPVLKAANFHMNNWIYYEPLAKLHGVELWSEEYQELLRAYFANQMDMRSDYLMLPKGEPIRDESGKVVDFDFTHVAMAGNLALEYDYKYIMGGFVARWVKWDGPDHYLLWDLEVPVTSVEGYRQLKLYFTRAWECVQKNNWQNRYMQCMVDEPCFPNSLAYRALGAICRSCMPGVLINDPVETTDVAGALDVWVVKQAIFEKYLDTYRQLQALGEEMWIYTCGFPAGATMNRVIDLPLSVSRLPMWMCYRYQCPGFLHWGYHYHTPEVEKATCCRGKNYKLPPGNGFVVYPARDGGRKPWYSVRGHQQRLGAQDWELLRQLEEKTSFETVDALICKVCRTFDDYDPSAAALDEVRHELLEMLEL